MDDELAEHGNFGWCAPIISCQSLLHRVREAHFMVQNSHMRQHNTHDTTSVSILRKNPSTRQEKFSKAIALRMVDWFLALYCLSTASSTMPMSLPRARVRAHFGLGVYALVACSHCCCPRSPPPPPPPPPPLHFFSFAFRSMFFVFVNEVSLKIYFPFFFFFLNLFSHTFFSLSLAHLLCFLLFCAFG